MWFPSARPLPIYKSGRNRGEDPAQIRNAAYIRAMAHNNGMVPRSKKARAPKGMSEAAAQSQAAVDKMPLAMGTAAPEAIDPAYETVPISEFVPHRPAR